MPVLLTNEFEQEWMSMLKLRAQELAKLSIVQDSRGGTTPGGRSASEANPEPRRFASIPYLHYSRQMENENAILAFAALAQDTRLEAFRMLVRHEPAGLPAGEIARQLAVPHNTMSSHLGILTRAGLIKPVRHSRSIIYRANLDQMRIIAGFLLKDCCGGAPEVCAPLIADLTPCCTPSEEKAHV